MSITTISYTFLKIFIEKISKNKFYLFTKSLKNEKKENEKSKLEKESHFAHFLNIDFYLSKII